MAIQFKFIGAILVIAIGITANVFAMNLANASTLIANSAQPALNTQPII